MFYIGKFLLLKKESPWTFLLIKNTRA